MPVQSVCFFSNCVLFAGRAQEKSEPKLVCVCECVCVCFCPHCIVFARNFLIAGHCLTCTSLWNIHVSVCFFSNCVLFAERAHGKSELELCNVLSLYLSVCICEYV